MSNTINIDLVKSADSRLSRAKRINPNVTARTVPIGELIERGALTVPELAAVTNLHPLTIRRAIAAGEIAAASNGKKGHYRITRADANEWWQQRGGSMLFPGEEVVGQIKPSSSRRAAAEKGFGFLKGRVSSSDAFLERKHAEAEREMDKDAARSQEKATA